MMKRIIATLATIGVTLASAPAIAQPASPDPVLDRDFTTMMAWFPGRYDNMEQVYFEGEQGTPDDERHERIHHIFYPIALDSFPGETFYIQQYQNDDPTDIYRQRIYSFEPDYEEGAIRLTIYTPTNTDALVDAHLDPSKLDGLTPEDTQMRPGCEVFWKRQANQFIGYMKDGACSFVSQRSGKKIIINDDLYLSQAEIGISDRAVDEDGNYVFGNKAGIPHKNRKAREFKCWVSVKKRAGDNEWSFDPNLIVHDQGGTAWVTTDERRPQKVGVKIRNVVWPSGRNRNSLVLYAYRDGDDRAVSYAWTEPEGKRIAVNLRWMQASCTLSDDQPY